MTSLAHRRRAALVAAIAVGFGALAIPNSAFAENGNVAGTDAAAVQQESLMNLDPDARGTLTIEKRSRTDDNGVAAGNGLPDAAVAGTPLAGLTYTIQRLAAYDLRTQAGWEQLAALGGDAVKAKAVGQPSPVTAELTKATGENGRATFPDLQLGAYLVTETSAPSGGYTLGEPFIVTVPMTHPKLNTWNYDPIVYPKNAKSVVVKTVDDSASVELGSDITYTLSADIPNLPGGQTLDYYQVVDQYDARLDITTTSLAIAGAGAGALTDQDYRLVKATNVGEDAKEKRITAVFTDAGRAKILAARKAGDASTKVEMTLSARIVLPVARNGVFKNKAILIPTEPSSEWDPGHTPATPPALPPAEVVSKYGKVSITKVSSEDPATKLAGAKFEVYRCANHDGSMITFEAGTSFMPGDFKLVGKPLRAYAVAADGSAPETPQSVFVTAGDGGLTIDALQNNDWEDGAAVAADKVDAYCLVEKAAPDGYELRSQPIAFQITQANASEKNLYTLSVEVKNVPTHGGFDLPVTGAQGIALLLTAGGILVLSGAAMAVVSRRRARAAS